MYYKGETMKRGSAWLKNIRRISNSIDVKFQRLIKPMKERQVSFIEKNIGEI